MDKEQRDNYSESTSHKSLLNHHKGVTQRLCFNSTGRLTETAFYILSPNTESLSHGKLIYARNLERFQNLLRIKFQTKNWFKFLAEAGSFSDNAAVNTGKIQCATSSYLLKTDKKARSGFLSNLILSIAMPSGVTWRSGWGGGGLLRGKGTNTKFLNHGWCKHMKIKNLL